MLAEQKAAAVADVPVNACNVPETSITELVNRKKALKKPSVINTIQRKEQNIFSAEEG